MKKLNLDKIIGFFPDELLKLSTEEQKISVQLYRHLAEGQTVSIERLSKSLGFSIEAVNNILSKWTGVYYDDAGYIAGYWGLTLKPTSHIIKFNSKVLYTWCAWDSLFIPGIIKKTARVESICPISRDKIRLMITSDGVHELDPSSAVMSFITTETAKLQENLIKNFCHFVHLFNSAETASEWISENERAFTLSVDEAYYLGKKKNEFQYKDVLNT